MVSHGYSCNLASENTCWDWDRGGINGCQDTVPQSLSA